MNRINVYFRNQPSSYKWIPGDRHLINFLRSLFNYKKTSGLEKVFINLCRGFDELKIDYAKNPSFKKIKPGQPVIVLGNGKYSLEGYSQSNLIIAGIGLMSHPSEWPGLFKEYPVAKYLQHSTWANKIYIPYYGEENCCIWPAGIDTKKWSPSPKPVKKIDILVYNKIRWCNKSANSDLRLPLLHKLNQLGLTYHEITYGQYNENQYFKLLQQCKAMIFLCEHESQGFACCEALSMNVPVLAWNQGYWLDPNRFRWNDEIVSATSVPYFDKNCGMTFIDFNDFEDKIITFWQNIEKNTYKPRIYILNNLTLRKSAERMLKIINAVYKID